MKRLLLLILTCTGISATAQNYARLDTTFNTIGSIVIDTPMQTLPQVNVKHALQRDGKIVLCGNRLTGFFTSDVTVTRIKPNGSLDSSFGVNGVLQDVHDRGISSHRITIQRNR